MTAQLEQALSGVSCEKLDISDEVKEQVYNSALDYNDPGFSTFSYVVDVEMNTQES